MKHIYISILFLLFSVIMFAQPVQFNFSNTGGQVAVNDLIDVDIRVSDFNNIAGMQFAIHWDDFMFPVESVENINTSIVGFSQSNIAYGDPNLFGALRLSWSGVTEVTLPDNALLFTLRLRASGPLCQSSGFSIYGSDAFPIEIFDFDLNLREYCTNTYVAQIAGPDCSSNTTLICNDNFNVSIGNSKVVLLLPDMVLEGGPYDYTSISVSPSKVGCSNDGQTITYTATDAVTGNSCWGNITVEDIIGVCDGSGTGNGSLVCNATVNVSLSQFGGDTQITPQMVLSGGPYDYSTISVTPSVVTCTDIGNMQYTVSDSETGNSCFGVLSIEDNTPPTVVTQQNIVVSLTDEYSAKVFIANIDNGSYDNCTPIDALVFEPDFYEFDCSDIGLNTVSLRVTDQYGNWNEVFTTILVELKNPSGSLSCPEDIIVDCTTDINNAITIETVLGQATLDQGCVAAYSDVLGYDENNDGDLDDSFVYQGETFSEKYLTACNTGVVEREWYINDNTNCTQRIYIGSGNTALLESEITWPSDKDYNCLDFKIEDPIFPDRVCSVIGFSMDTETLVIADAECLKMLVNYTVIDWCNFNSTTGEGLFSHTTVLRLLDNEPPVVTVTNQVISGCQTSGYNLSATATDVGCVDKNLSWEISLDVDSDLTEDYTTSGTSVNGSPFVFNVPSNIVNPVGTHSVVWKAIDNCGNVRSITSTFTVSDIADDLEAPTPYCINLSTALLTNGQVELYAKDFNIGSFDNCTDANDLRYTFDDISPSSDPSFNNAINSSVRVFTEADLNGMDEAVISVGMYVWDESNNRDFCIINLRLINGSNGSSDLSLRFPNVIANENDVVCVPLLADGFNGVGSIQGTVTWNAQVLQYKNTQSYALQGMSSSAFNNSSDSELRFAWFDNTGLNSATLPDGSSVFEVCFDVIGSNGQSSIVQILDNGPTTVEVGDNNGQNINVELRSGSVTIGQASDCINDTTPPIAICDNQVIASTTNGSVTLSIDAFDSGSYDNCTSGNDLLLTYDDGTTSKEFNLVNADSNGEITVVMNVKDESNNVNSCFTTLVLNDNDCVIDENDILFPTALLDVNVAINNISEVGAMLSPDALLTLAGIENGDVYPTYSQTGCPNILETYEDNVFIVDAALGWYKVIRRWTVLDWLTANVYTGDQVIRNYVQADEYICDTLPRSAPDGDCASGHTFSDDVEWPNDLNIADHRIKPSELITASMVDSLDARPNFYGDAQFYTLSYVDFVSDLTQETLIMDREWTAARTDIIGLSWNYTQKITIDLSTFGMLVTVNTLNNRPVPDVDVDGFSMTNAQGLVYTDGSVDPSKPDAAINGLNILDLILMQAHQLGIKDFDEFQLMAGDINDDQSITNSDLSAVRKVILGIDDQLSSAWTFVDMTSATESGLEPKGHYVALKPGDVDDTAVLSSDIVIDATERIIIKDTIINAGQNYSIPLFIERDISSLGAELHLDFDTDFLSIRSVSSTDAFGEISWSFDGDDKIVILNYNGDGQSEMITSRTPILTIEFEAIQNGTLAGLFDISEEKNSWIVSENYGLLLIDGEIKNQIGTGTTPVLENLGINVYPNPASNLVVFDMNNTNISGDYNIQIMDITGRVVIDSNNESQINLSNVDSGMYLYKIRIADQAQTGKLLIKK